MASLLEFLKFRCLGFITIGIPQNDVLCALGEPDDRTELGREPELWRYGGLPDNTTLRISAKATTCWVESITVSMAGRDSIYRISSSGSSYVESALQLSKKPLKDLTPGELRLLLGQWEESGKGLSHHYSW